MRFPLILLICALGVNTSFGFPGFNRPTITAVAAGVNNSVVDTGALVLNGAHGHPLQRFAEAGHFTGWVAGDLGADNYGSRSGNIGVAEVGGGYNFGPVQLNLALGVTNALQHTLNDGKTSFDGRYVVVDAIGAIPGTPLVGTLTGFGQWGQIDTTRNVLPAASFNGSTESRVSGGAARLDWVDASLVTHEITFTPYTKFTASRVQIGAYGETGGLGAASYGQSNDKLFEQTLGVNLARPLTKTVTLTGTLEGVHRFEGRAPAITGTLSTPGESYRQNWLRGSVGVDYALSNGVLSVSVNATTYGDAPNAWLATSYQMHF